MREGFEPPRKTNVPESVPDTDPSFADQVRAAEKLVRMAQDKIDAYDADGNVEDADEIERLIPELESAITNVKLQIEHGESEENIELALVDLNDQAELLLDALELDDVPEGDLGFGAPSMLQ